MHDGKPTKEPWYGVRSLFYDKANKHYEERTIVIRANSHDEALTLAADEAQSYSASLEGVEYLGYSDTFHIFDDTISSGTEVFSLLRKTDMNRDEYVDRFLDTGLEQRSERAS